MTPDNKAEVVRTHIDRWLAVNRNRLTAEQIAVVEENRALAVLSRQDAGQAFTIEGAYIPKP